MIVTRLLFIRETDQQITGSNCCGKLEGENACPRGEYLFPENRAVMESVGRLYRAVKERFSEDDVEVEMVDPRNQIYLVPRLIRDALRFRLPLSEALRTLFTFSIPSIIINGRLVYSGELPGAHALIEKIESFKTAS